MGCVNFGQAALFGCRHAKRVKQRSFIMNLNPSSDRIGTAPMAMSLFSNKVMAAVQPVKQSGQHGSASMNEIVTVRS